ncbi:MAG: NAD(P)H-dependent glycerol-3-phosphate dehydrogenase [Pseudomonadales bacterium]|nr:NAD(P)H-dependent glycerol-3-phosphate dehydrogenase [Pseudomonadales bacterium]
MRIAVLGGGSFGTVLAHLVASRGHDTILWLRDDAQCKVMQEQHENVKYLPGFNLHAGLKYSTDLEKVLAAADLVFFSVPSKAVRRVAREARPFLKEDAWLVSTTKGIEKDGFKLMSEIIAEETGSSRLGVLSGPNLAREIAAGVLSGTVIASREEPLRQAVFKALACARFRVFANSDTYGVELGGALKNIYAIASGMAATLSPGENSRSMLLTRSLAEMSRFATKMGANPLTFLGLSGVGDLIATCSSPLSRNYQVGQALAKGHSLSEIVEDLEQTAEGINTIEQVKHKADALQVYMPIVQGLYAIVFEQQPVAEIIAKLMTGGPSEDVEFMLMWGSHAS